MLNRNPDSENDTANGTGSRYENRDRNQGQNRVWDKITNKNVTRIGMRNSREIGIESATVFECATRLFSEQHPVWNQKRGQDQNLKGILLQNERRYEQAIKSFEKAIHFRPSMALAYVNLGASLVAAGRAAEAAGVLRAAARTTGDVRDRRQHDAARVSALVQLAALHSRRAHWHKALAAYREALDIMPETGPPLSGWTRHVFLIPVQRDVLPQSLTFGSLRWPSAEAVNDLESIRKIWNRFVNFHTVSTPVSFSISALTPVINSAPRPTYYNSDTAIGDGSDLYEPENVLSMVGETYAQLQQWGAAERSVLAALAAAPRHAHTHLTYAKLLARNSSRALEAEMWFKRAMTLAPEDPFVRDQFGLFLRDQHRSNEAAEQLTEAARLAPRDAARATAAARALRDARRCRAAERWYAKAAELNPQSAESHSNLGAILHLNGKYGQAAAAYRRALALEPGDAITLTNLQRVQTLMARRPRNKS